MCKMRPSRGVLLPVAAGIGLRKSCPAPLEKVQVNVDLERCIRGDKQAWDDFVRASAGLIYAGVQRALRGREDLDGGIDDRVQDVFLRLLRNDRRLLRQYDPSRAALSTYLTLITRSVVREHLQRRRLPTIPLEVDQPARPVGASTPADPGSPGGPGSPDGSEKLPAHLLNGLTDRQRTVLRMLFEDNLSVVEVATRLQIDPQTVRSAKHKAIMRLRAVRSRVKPDPAGDALPVDRPTTKGGTRP
jgi:RNA polymerase sigma-70 factor (ECF subfamily)